MSRADLLAAAASYAHVRTFRRRHRTRAAVERWQSRRIERWLAYHARRVPAFADMPPGTPLSELPVMTKTDLMAAFASYNVAGIDAAQGWQAFETTKSIDGYVVGASTGTSGNRGLFVISQTERYRWLGAILAKGLPDFWRRRDRVAVLLPLDTPLYDTANATGRLLLRFFDTSAPLNTHRDALARFDPTVLIAPPRVLRGLVALELPLRPRAVFSAAEKLEAFDRAAIEAGFATPLREIYMASEGLFAVSCRHGRLHLAEDCMLFELEDRGGGRVSPLITDFSRTTQIMLRYRMNDLLVMDDAPCPCGSPLRVVREIVGRVDDVFHLRSTTGGTVELTPDILRNAIVDADRAITDFRLVQTAPDYVELHLETGNADAVTARLAALFARHGCAPQVGVRFRDLAPLEPGKLRRVRNETGRQRRDA